MDAIFHEWGSLLLRWVHIITGIAWIGASFYFMHLDASLRAVAGAPRGVGGEAWEVHGGGFYEVRKYLVAPDHLPEELIWHKWQAYSTWLSGMALLIWMYYLQSSLYLIDPAVLNISAPVAAAIGIVSLFLGWVVYDRLCKSSLGKNEVALASVGFVFVIAMAAFFQHVFSPRGAFIHTGALMGTIMVANVFRIVIPNQNKVVAALKAGEIPDPALGAEAKLRSAHNNYLTLPVLFLMISSHFPMTYSSPFAYVVVGLVLVAGALIRVFYNERHEGHGDKWWTWGVAAVCIAFAVGISMMASSRARDELGFEPLNPPTAVAANLPRQVVNVVTSRCSMCHASEPVWDGIAAAPKGVKLDTPGGIAANAPAIYMEAVLTRAMPPNNITEMKDAERRILRDWLAPK